MIRWALVLGVTAAACGLPAQKRALESAKPALSDADRTAFRVEAQRHGRSERFVQDVLRMEGALRRALARHRERADAVTAHCLVRDEAAFEALVQARRRPTGRIFANLRQAHERASKALLDCDHEAVRRSRRRQPASTLRLRGRHSVYTSLAEPKVCEALVDALIAEPASVPVLAFRARRASERGEPREVARHLSAAERAVSAGSPFDEVHVRGAKAYVADREGAYDDAVAHIEARMAVHRRVFGDTHPELVENGRDLAWYAGAQGDGERAVRILRQVHRSARALYGPHASVTLSAASDVAMEQIWSGQLESAKRGLESITATAAQWLGPHSPVTLDGWFRLGLLASAEKNYTAARRSYRRALSGLRRLWGGLEGRAVDVTIAVGDSHRDEGRSDDALEWYYRAAGPDVAAPGLRILPLAELTVSQANALRNITLILSNQYGRRGRAIQLGKLAVTAYERHLGPGAANTGYLNYFVGWLILEYTNSPRRGLDHLRRALVHYGRLGDDHAAVRTIRYHMARGLLEMNDGAAAAAILRRLHAFGPPPPPVTPADLDYQLGRAERLAGQRQAALRALERSANAMRESENVAFRLTVLFELIEVELDLSSKGAANHARTAYALAKRRWTPLKAHVDDAGSPKYSTAYRARQAMARAAHLRARAMRQGNRVDEAARWLAEAVALEPDPCERAVLVREELADIRWRQGRRDEARALIDRATDMLLPGNVDPTLRARIRAKKQAWRPRDPGPTEAR